MASRQLLSAEALACPGCRHACHVMLYCDTETQLFGSLPIQHIVLMQMRFDGLLGFPGGFVDPAESLEEGLSRELSEELGVALSIQEDDHLDSCYGPASSSSSSSPRLITHFYAKKMEEEQIRELERAAVTTATDYGQEVLGMVRVPLYTMEDGGGLAPFLSHSFVGNARSQLTDSLLRLHLVAPEELRDALARAADTGERRRRAAGRPLAGRGEEEAALKRHLHMHPPAHPLQHTDASRQFGASQSLLHQ